MSDLIAIVLLNFWSMIERTIRLKVGNIDDGNVYVKQRDLRPGIVISEDVFVNTNHPIIRRNTVILPKHLEVLKAFGVREVKTEEQNVVKRDENLATESNFIDPDDVLATIPTVKVDLKTKYNEAVQQFKKEFARMEGR